MMIKQPKSEIKYSGATVEAKLIDNVKDRTVLIFHKEGENIQEKRTDTDKDIQKYKLQKFYRKMAR